MTEPGAITAQEERGSTAGLTAALVVALLVMVVVAYLPAMAGGFIWDDDRYVASNPLLGSFDGLQRIWVDIGATVQYYPLVFTTFWVEHRLWGIEPLGYHIDNILIHAISAVLVWRVLRRLSVPGAWVAAAVFALHPVHVESVAWVTERKNVLSGMLVLGAALAYLRFAGVGGKRSREQDGEGEWGAYGTALVLFVGALLSKTVAASLPAALLLVLWWKKDRIGWRDVKPLLPMFLAGIALGLNTAWLEKTNVKAIGADWALSFADRFLIATRAPWFYLQKLVAPVDLTFIYPRWEIDPGAWWQWIWPMLTIGLVVGLWLLRKRLGKGPLVAVLFFGGTLFPALGFVNTYPMRYSFVADHFQYIASIGVIALLVAASAAALGVGAGREEHEPASSVPPRPVTAAVIAAIVLCLLGGLTFQQGRIYRDRETLYRDTLEKNPACWMAHNNLAVILIDREDFDEADAHLQEALRLKDDFYEAHHNTGRIRMARGEYEGAIASWNRVLEIKPDHRRAHGRLGLAYHANDEPGRALDHLRRQTDRTPGQVDARLDLAQVLDDLGRTAEAEAIRREAAALGPDPAAQHLARGNALADQRRLEEAIVEFRRAIAIDANRGDAHLSLAQALEESKRDPEAIPHYVRAAQLMPDSALAHYRLGSALARAGRLDGAINAFQRVVEIDPNDAGVYTNLGLLLKARGRNEEARAAFEAAVRINPAHPRATQELEAMGGG